MAKLHSDSLPKLLTTAVYRTLVGDDTSAGSLVGADWKPAPPPIWVDPLWRAHLLDGLADEEYTER